MRFTQPILYLFLSVAFTCCHTPRQVAGDVTGKDIRIDATLPADVAVDSLMDPYRNNMKSAMQEIVGYSSVPLTKAQPECTLGNFVADAVRAAAKEQDSNVVAAVVNYGGLRLVYLSPGPIKRGDIYKLMPFDDNIVLIDVPGKVLLHFCDHIAALGGWPVSGLQFQIRNKKAEAVFLNGRPVNPHLVYRVAVPDYVANGGDHCDFLRKCPKTTQNILVRRALTLYLKNLQEQGRKLTPAIENRIVYAQ